MVMSRWVPYGAASVTLAVAVVVHAFQERPNFYAACVYLSQSSACSLVLTNMFFLTTLIIGKALQHIYFGRLRAIEVEHLYERSWYAVTESCLAMTIFREEFDSRFLLFFTALIFLKIFHWLAQDRVDLMEQTPEVSRMYHLRMTSVILVLLIADLSLVSFSLDDILERGPNAMIMFAFEFTILASVILAAAGKYALNIIESRQTEAWDSKSTYVFYLELLTDFVKLVTYIAFFATVFTFYGLPLHIVRDLYVTLRSFTTKCRNFLRFRRATRDMDTRYPDASVTELAALSDPTCIVCRDDMVHASQPVPEGEAAPSPLDKPKKLPCGHILHFRCLRSWLERQQSCPMCRRPVLEDAPAAATAAAQGAHQPGPRHNAAVAAPPGLPAQPQQANAGRAGRLAVAPGPAIQYPREFGGEPVPLPADFELPPGWALLPVTTEPNPALDAREAATASRPGTRSAPGSAGSAAPAAASRTQSESRAQLPDGSQAPPIIPLFSTGLGSFGSNFANSDVEAIVPTLTDEQIGEMEVSTRRTIEERLRVLAQVQARVIEGLVMLTRLASITVPSTTTAESTSVPHAAAATEAPAVEENELKPATQPETTDSALLPDDRLRPALETSTERSQSRRRSPRRRRASQESEGSASSGGGRRSVRIASRQADL